MAAIAVLLALPSSARASNYTWRGASSSANWSDPGNWGGAAPGGSVGTLSFPALSGCNASTQTCYVGNNDQTGIDASGLAVDDGVGYRLTGNPLTLSGSGSGTTLSAATSASPGGATSSVIATPITLSGSQTWSVNGGSGAALGIGQLQLAGSVTDTSATDTLWVDLSNAGYLNLSADDEVGPVTITGVDSSKSGMAASQNGFLDLSNKLNAVDGHAVTLDHAAVNDVGNATVGPLSSNGGIIELGDVSPGPPPGSPSGMLTVNGAASLDSASALLATIQQSGTTAGTDYGQLAASGAVIVGGTLTVDIGSSCPTLNNGDVYTLVTGSSLSGTFSNAPTDGSTITTQAAFSCPSYTLQINYTATSVTATVTAGGANGPPVEKTPPTISGTTTEGQTLTESHGTWTNNPDPNGYTYQWEKCDVSGNGCSAISGATNQTYTLAASDVCHTIRVQETARNTAGSGQAATSNPTALVQSASSSTDFTWTGASIPYDGMWSTATNWSRCQAPQGSVGTLSFQSTACNPGSSSNPSGSCAMSQDVPGLAASTLDFGSGAAWTLNGADALKLNSGLSGSAVINAPIALGADNTWAIRSLGLGGDLSGAPHALNVTFSSQGNLALTGASNEVGPVNINSPNVFWSQLELGVPNSTGAPPGDLNGSDGNSVTLNGILLYGDGGTVGPLTATNSLLELNDRPEVLAVSGAASLGPTDEIYFRLQPGNGSPSPGADYSQLTATDRANINGTILWLYAGCGQPPGTAYTLVDAQGGVTGQFENPNSPNGPPTTANDGSVIQSQGSCPGGPTALKLHYTADTVTATVMGPPSARTGSASDVTTTTATLNGAVDPNGADLSDCHFDYGASTSYGSSIPCAQLVGSGFSDVPVSAAIVGLSPGTTYHYRLSASNSLGTGRGSDATFTTTTAPPAQPTGPTTSGGGAPTPACADHSATVGLYVAETDCFKREGSRLVTDGRVRLDGLDITPDASTRLTLDLGTGHLSDGLATVYVGSIPVYFGPLDLDLRSNDDLVKLNLKAKIAGMPLAGSLALTPTAPGELTAKVSATVSSTYGPIGLGWSVSGSLDLKLSNDAGLELDKAELGVEDIPLGPMTLSKAELSYEHAAYGEVWKGSGELELPDPLPSIGVTVGLTNGKLSEVGFSVGELNKPVGEIVFLQKLGLDVKWIPNVVVKGEIGLSVGPNFDLEGQTVDLASLDSTLTFQFTNPFVIEVQGDLHVLTDKITLATADVKWTVPSRFEVTAHAGYSIGPASVSADGAGLFASNGFGFKAQGQVSVPGVTAQGLVYVSEKGITGCAGIQAGPTGILGGFGYHWGAGFPDLWFDNCDGMLDYNTAAAGSPGSARDAAAAQPVHIRVPKGQRQTLFGARGVSDYPSFTLRSPTGQTIDPSRGAQGAIDRGGYRWVTDPEHHGTYVFVAKPTPGIWTLTPSPGSPAIGSTGYALSAPLTVAAHVTRRGRTEILSWKAPAVPGQSLRFTEVGGDVGRPILLTTRSTGSFRFTPTDTGRGERRYVQVEIARGGMPEAIIRGPGYLVPRPPRPSVPARVRISRSSTSVTITWSAARRAHRYDVWVIASDGRRLFFESPRRQRSLRVPDVIFPIRVRVSVTAIAADGLRSQPRLVGVRLPVRHAHHGR